MMAKRILFAAILLSAFAVAAPGQDLSNSLALVHDDGRGHLLPYRLFLPPGHDQPGSEFPLVLFLHGAGERGTNNTSQLAYIYGLINATRTNHPAFLLVPQSPFSDFWGVTSPGEFSPATAQVLQVISQIEAQYPVDTSRRMVTGLSMGGFGTWDLVNELPDMFEAAVPMSSWGDNSRPQNYLSTRIWAHQGKSDGVTPPGPARDTIQAIREAGGDPLYSEVAGDHGIWQPIYDDPIGDLYNWMFDGVAPQVPTFTYDPNTGSVTIDPSRAPGGRIAFLRIASTGSNQLSIPAEVSIDGVAVPSEQFFSQATATQLSFSAPIGATGLTGVLEIPGLFPRGLEYQEVHAFARLQQYRSPVVNQLRPFEVRFAVVPEPTAIASVVVSLLAGALARRAR